MSVISLCLLGYKIGLPKTAHNIILVLDGIWSWNRDRLPGAGNKFSSKVAHRLKFLLTFLKGIAPILPKSALMHTVTVARLTDAKLLPMAKRR